MFVLSLLVIALSLDVGSRVSAIIISYSALSLDAGSHVNSFNNHISA